MSKPSKTRAITRRKEDRSLRDISVYSDAINSLVSLANVSTTSGQSINERTAISIITVFAAIRNIADDIAKMERGVFRKLTRGKLQVFDHPMHRLICQSPNPEMGCMDFFRALMGGALLFGNGYAEIIRDRYTGEPLHAYPIHPWRVRVLRDAMGMLYYSLDGCRRVEIGNMLHIKNFGTNGILGIMTIRSAKEGLGLLSALESYGASFFGNGALPKGVFYSDGPLSEEGREDYLKKWNNKYRGAGRGNSAAILPHGFKFQTIASQNNDGQFLETRAFQLLEVCRLYRLPPHKLMDVSKGTMNNMEQQNGEYVQDCLMSWVVQIEEELSRKLKRPEEVDIFPKFLVRSFFRGDMKARQEFYASGIQWGYLSPDDVLEMEDKNPRADGRGHIYIVPQNYSAASALETMTKSQLTMLALHAKDNGVEFDKDGYPVLTGPNNVPPPDDEQSDPAQQATPEMNVPPPPGIVLPGTQPIDDSFFGRSKRIIEAQKPLLAHAFRRLLHTECDKVTRASKKDGFIEWTEKFYGEHDAHIRAAIAPQLKAMAETVLVATPSASDELRAKVETLIGDIATKHIRESREQLAQEIEVSGIQERAAKWEQSRPAAAADDAAGELLKVICPAGDQHEQV